MPTTNQTAAQPHAGARQAAPALVVGLSIHGLAVARALAREGVDVHCLSDIEQPPQPSTRTRFARVHFRSGLNTGPLAQYLKELAEEIGGREKIVLFPTSDRIAKAIAKAWSELESRYLLSWAHCRDLVLELQRKDSLAHYCERAQVRHPRSRTVAYADECESAASGLQFPLVVKPAQPLSSFKAIRVRDLEELRQCVTRHPQDSPFVVQEWIEGPEPSLYSCTTYLDRGKPVHMFTSRKIAASPPGLGQGTVFETIDNRETQEMTERFVRELDLSGPVAVEFKRDAAGKLWLIEPNVGRTEYCVDLAIQSGFNLPYIEYLHVTGALAQTRLDVQERSCAWFDTDKDPTCLLANLRILRDGEGRPRKAVFPYLGHGDWAPLAAAAVKQLSRLCRAVVKRVAAPLRRGEVGT